MRNRIVYTFILVCFGLNLNAQYNKGQFGIGGEFSFVNSRNTLNRSTTDFANSYNNGFNLGLNAGGFISSRDYLYGVLETEYGSFKRDFVTDNLTNKTEQDVFSSTFTLQAGVGLRRYFKVNEKNIVGFFFQGQALVGNSWVTRRNFAAQNDSVFQDIKENYPVRILNLNINPGVYVNITPQWQLTVNIGDLYFVQTIIPESAEVNQPRQNSSFGLDVNLFDFRLGVLYTPRK